MNGADVFTNDLFELIKRLVFSAHPFFGTVLFISFNVTVIFFMLNIFLSIIAKAFEKTRLDEKVTEVDFDFYDYVVLKLKEFFGKTTRSLDAQHVSINQNKVYVDFVNYIPDKVDMLIAKLINVNIY